LRIGQSDREGGRTVLHKAQGRVKVNACGRNCAVVSVHSGELLAHHIKHNHKKKLSNLSRAVVLSNRRKCVSVVQPQGLASITAVENMFV
jgi:hypothetical protein